MLFDLINFQKLKKALVYAVYMALTLLVQDLVFSRIGIFGVRAFFVPAAVAAVGLFEDGVWGAVFGLFTGLFCDMLFGYDALFIWLFPCIGFFAGLGSRFLVNSQLLGFLGLCLAAFLLTGFCQAFGLLVFMGQSLLPILLTILLQTLWSLPLAVPLFYICRRIASPEYES